MLLVSDSRLFANANCNSTAINPIYLLEGRVSAQLIVSSDFRRDIKHEQHKRVQEVRLHQLRDNKVLKHIPCLKIEIVFALQMLRSGLMKGSEDKF